jgi:hypothetical protein
MEVQSLLFDRGSGWNESKSKAWAKAHGYKYGKVDVTDQYVRIRQSDPKGSQVKRTVPFGRGIRAVVAREESMRTTTVKASRRRRSKKKAPVARKRPRRRRANKAAVKARRPRRRRVRAAVRQARRSAPMVMEASRKKKRRPSRRRRVVHAWKGNSAGHATAAKKGWRRKKARRKTSGRRRKSRRVTEATYVAAPRRRRASKRRRVHAVAEAPRRTKRRHHRRHYGMRASRGSRGGMGAAELAVAIVSGGLGFVLADGLDRLIATYDPAATDKPKDKFTSDGAGTLANTLNVAAMPNWKRLLAGASITAAPAIGSMYIRNPMVKASVEGMAVGAGVSLFKTLWQNVLMPLLVGKDTSAPALQKSYIARLYPAEVAAHINLAAQKGADGKLPPGPYSSTGVLSGQQAQQQTAGVGASDVGPFALSGDSPYPDAAQSLRQQAGVHDQFPTLQNRWGTGGPGSDYPTAAQAMGTGAPAGHGNPGQPGVSDSYQPGPPPGPGPGPQAAPNSDPSCGCIGDSNPFLGFIGDAQEDQLTMRN